MAVDDGGTVVLSVGGRPFWQLRPQDVIAARVPRVTVGRFLAWDEFREQGGERRRAAAVVRREVREGEWHVAYADRRGRPVADLTLVLERPWQVGFRLQADAAGMNRVGLAWRGAREERFFGFGVYGRGPEIRRGRFASWAEEGPVGLGPLSPWLRWTGRVPLPRGPYASYAPVPCWLSSERWGGWIDNSERLIWTIRPGYCAVGGWTAVLEGHLVVGDSLGAVLQREREVLGRPPRVPPWVLGPWIDAVRGEATVRETVERLRAHRIPATAIWVEDWMGSWENSRRFWMRPLSHRLDRTLYPDVPGLARSLHREGLRLLGYFCPEVAEGTDLYREAAAGGHLAVDAGGRPVVVEILGRRHGELDLTRVETQQWVADRLLAPAERLGFDGWMADFGEHLPVEARLADGTTGWSTHNRYPALWQATQRRFWEQARPDGDYTFFVRSASLFSADLAPVLWGGDSDTDWDPADGLASVVPQALSAGLLGHALFATDIAGYMTFGLTRPSDRELYLRWTQLGALLPVMRTHHGTARPRNWHWAKDADTTAIFARYARLHMLLYPYLYTLAEAAGETGWPIARPLFLHYPGPDTYPLRDEYLLGPDILVAPILRRGARRRRVFLPEGGWISWWTGQRDQGPGWRGVEAPLDRIPLWVREGAVLPLAEGRGGGGETDAAQPPGFVDTLVPERDGGDWQGLDTADRVITVWLVGALSSGAEVRLPGNRRLDLRGGGAAPPPDAVRWVGRSRWADHCPAWSSPSPSVVLTPGIPATAPVSQNGVTLEYKGPGTLEVVIRGG